MGENVLLMTLSNKIEEKKYNCRYRFKEYDGKLSKEYNNQYYTTVFLEKIDIDNIICIGTLESSWDYLYEDVYSYFADVNKEDVNLIKEIIKKENSPTEEKIYEFFSEKTNGIIKIIIIEEETKINDIIKKIFGIKESLNNFKQIYIDITGGIRIQSVAILQLLNHLYYYNNEQKMIFLGQLIDSNKNESIIFEDMELFERMRTLNEINSFIKYGSPEGLRTIYEKYPENKDFIDSLEKIFLAQQFNLIDLFKKNIFNTKENKIKENQFIVWKSIEKVFDEWVKAANNVNNFYVFLELLTRMNFYKGNLGLAYVNLERFLLKDSIIKQYKIGENDIKNIKKNRNSIVHSYDIYNELDYDNLKSELEKFCKKYNIFKNKEKHDVLIWNLGVGENQTYKEAIYEYKNKKFKTRFSLEVYLKNSKDKFKEIYILGSRTSIWKELFESLLKIYEPKEKIEFKSNDIEELNETFSKLDTRLKCVFIPSGGNIKESEEIFEILNDKIMKPLSENCMDNAIVYDLTHMYRATSVYLLNAINYFEALYYNIKLKNIHYSFLRDGVSPIKNFKEVLDIMRLYKTISDFEKYNRFDFTSNLINGEIANLAKNVSNCFIFNDIKSFEKLRKNFFSKKPKHKNDNDIENKIFEILTNIFGNKNLDTKIQFMKQQFKANNLAFVLSNIKDYYHFDLFKVSSNKFKDDNTYQEEVKKIDDYVKNTNKKFKQIHEIINELIFIRNISGHTSNEEIKIPTKLKKIPIEVEVINEKIKTVLDFFENNLNEIKEITKNWR